MLRFADVRLLPLFALVSGCVMVTDSRTTDPDAESDGGSSGADTEGSDGSASDSSSGADDSGGSGGDETTAGGSDATGEELYLMCAGCHGAQGEGSELGYELRHPDREFATWVVRNGRPGDEFENSTMIAYDESVLSDEDLEKIWDYLDSFDQPTTGEELYLDYCGNCHGADGSGGIVAVDITDKLLADTVESVRVGKGGTDYDARAFYMPALDETTLSEDEVQAMIDYWGG